MNTTVNHEHLRKLHERQRKETEAFLEDYNDMRSWGVSDRQIAQRLGIRYHSLLRRLRRNGIPPETTRP